jgi:hypothetical protein
MSFEKIFFLAALSVIALLVIVALSLIPFPVIELLVGGAVISFVVYILFT